MDASHPIYAEASDKPLLGDAVGFAPDQIAASDQDVEWADALSRFEQLDAALNAASAEHSAAETAYFAAKSSPVGSKEDRDSDERTLEAATARFEAVVDAHHSALLFVLRLPASESDEVRKKLELATKYGALEEARDLIARDACEFADSRAEAYQEGLQVGREEFAFTWLAAFTALGGSVYGSSPDDMHVGWSTFGFSPAGRDWKRREAVTMQMDWFKAMSPKDQRSHLAYDHSFYSHRHEGAVRALFDLADSFGWDQIKTIVSVVPAYGRSPQREKIDALSLPSEAANYLARGGRILVNPEGKIELAGSVGCFEVELPPQEEERRKAVVRDLQAALLDDEQGALIEKAVRDQGVAHGEWLVLEGEER